MLQRMIDKLTAIGGMYVRDSALNNQFCLTLIDGVLHMHSIDKFGVPSEYHKLDDTNGTQILSMLTWKYVSDKNYVLTMTMRDNSTHYHTCDTFDEAFALLKAHQTRADCISVTVDGMM